MRKRSKYFNIRRQYHLNNYKVKKGCSECGYKSHSAAIHWDHIIPLKNRNLKRISTLIGSSSLKTLFKRIKQCQLLCANCHAIKSDKERKEDYANSFRY